MSKTHDTLAASDPTVSVTAQGSAGSVLKVRGTLTLAFPAIKVPGQLCSISVVGARMIFTVLCARWFCHRGFVCGFV